MRVYVAIFTLSYFAVKRGKGHKKELSGRGARYSTLLYSLDYISNQRD